MEEMSLRWPGKGGERPQLRMVKLRQYLSLKDVLLGKTNTKSVLKVFNETIQEES